MEATFPEYFKIGFSPDSPLVEKVYTDLIKSIKDKKNSFSRVMILRELLDIGAGIAERYTSAAVFDGLIVEGRFEDFLSLISYFAALLDAAAECYGFYRGPLSGFLNAVLVEPKRKAVREACEDLMLFARSYLIRPAEPALNGRELLAALP